MRTIIYVITICLFLFTGAVDIRTQSFNVAFAPVEDFKDAVNKAKEEILKSDIGSETQSWLNSLKENNIKLKLIFDEEGFDLMVSTVRLGKRLINEGNVLKYEDIVMLLKLLNTVERLGAPPSSNLKEKIFQRINNSVNKKWDGIINTLCGYEE